MEKQNNYLNYLFHLEYALAQKVFPQYEYCVVTFEFKFQTKDHTHWKVLPTVLAILV